MAPPPPDHVVKVIAEFQTVRLEHTGRCRRPLPEPFNPIVICVLKDERDRLADFLRHYREAGIERFAFIDNGSSDGTAAYLARQPDVDLYVKTGEFHWIAKQGWINRLIQTYGYDRWYIYVDADEHIVFDGLGPRSFADLARQMEQRGILRVRGLLVDMYGSAPLLEDQPLDGRPLLQLCPYHDATGYREARFREIMSVKGGPRVRAFGRADAKFAPEMTKYPLFRIGPGEFMANPHHIWPWDRNFASPRVLAILHFKFLSDTAGRIRRAIERSNYWDRSFEYRCYAKVLTAEPWLSLLGPPSRRYGGPEALLDAGLIVPVGWSRPVASTGVREAFRRRRAAMLAMPAMPEITAEAALPTVPPPAKEWHLPVAALDSDFVGFMPGPATEPADHAL